MLEHLANRVVKDAWVVVGAWVVLAALLLTLTLTGLGGKALFDRLEGGTVGVDGTESAEGQELLDTLAGDGETVTLQVTGTDLSDPAVVEGITKNLEPTHTALNDLLGEGSVLDPFVIPGGLTEPAAQVLASKDQDGFLVVVTVDPNGDEVASADDDQYHEQLDELVGKVEDRLRAVPAALHDVAPQARGTVSDDSLLASAVTDQVEKDLVTGELISLPLSLLIMVLVFGGFLAAGMPLIGALAAIAGSLGVLYGLTYVMDLQSFVVSIVTVIGLGLSIDYGLLITSRYREELARLDSADASPEVGGGRRRRRRPVVATAMRTTIMTTGRTVMFSALTVAIGMLGLLLTGTSVLHSIGLAGVAVVLITVAAAVTLVPAVLVLLGDRMRRPSVLSRVPLLGSLQRRMGDVTSEEGVFSRLAHAVHRVPWLVLVACLVLLVVLAAPVRHLHMLSSTTEMLPPHSDQRDYLRVLEEDYPAAAQPDATLVIAGTGQRVTDYVGRVAQADGVESVLSTATAGSYTVVYLGLAGDPWSSEAEDAVASVRDVSSPADRWVTGQAATQLDFRLAIEHGLPWVLGTIVAVTFVLLFLMTGSVLVPLKALIINSISLAASIGALTWVFQEGHLEGTLGFTSVGGLESYVVITAVGVGFGLAMDYEVFLLARIKEYWDHGCDNDTAVERGLQRSGRVVTSAALIMVTVFLGFVAGGLLAVKEIGVAMAIIVTLDATVVRMLIVPATMTLLGSWNWWAPAPLRRVYERYRIEH